MPTPTAVPDTKRMLGVVSVMSLAEYEDRYHRDGPVTDQTQWSPAGFVPTPLRDKYGENLVAVIVEYKPTKGFADPGPALVAVLNMDTGAPLWTNPANEGLSTTRYIAAALLLADAQAEQAS